MQNARPSRLAPVRGPSRLSCQIPGCFLTQGPVQVRSTHDNSGGEKRKTEANQPAPASVTAWWSGVERPGRSFVRVHDKLSGGCAIGEPQDGYVCRYVCRYVGMYVLKPASGKGMRGRKTCSWYSSCPTGQSSPVRVGKPYGCVVAKTSEDEGFLDRLSIRSSIVGHFEPRLPTRYSWISLRAG